ncbi:hypothetical protein JCM14467A_05010 [Vulcanisaeta sp. JCM 14467]
MYGLILPLAALTIVISTFILAIIIGVLMLFPRSCKFLGGHIELSTHLCREKFRMIEIVNEKDRLREYSVIVPIGFRAYPWVYGWGFGSNIPGGVLVFSTSDCGSKWRLDRLADSNGREFYMILCCGS